MNFIKSLSTKSKTVIVTVIVVIIGYFVVTTITKPTPKKALDSLSISFSGYNGSGYATYNHSKTDDQKAYNAFKDIAMIEAKKAQIDTKTVEQIIKSTATYSELVNKLTSSDTFSNVATSPADVIKYSNFQNHMEKTTFKWENSSSLSNGKKITLTLQDDSSVPYFDKVSKTYTAKGLKQPKTITLSEKDFSIKSDGTNGYASIIVKYGKTTLFDSSSYSYSAKNKRYKNGDTITIKSSKISNELDTEAKKFTINGKNINFKVSGLPDATLKITNLNDIVKKVNESDDLTFDSAYLMSDNSKLSSPELILYFKDNKDNEYHYYTNSNIGNVKDNKISTDSLFFPIYETTKNSPETDILSFNSSYSYVYKLIQ